MTDLQDRRHSRRYELELDLRYRVVRGGEVAYEGHGKTRDISTTGLCFATDALLPEGATVEIAIDWPVRLGGRMPLSLNVMGRVIRSDRHGIGVRMMWREFEVTGMPPAPMVASAAAAAYTM